MSERRRWVVERRVSRGKLAPSTTFLEHPVRAPSTHLALCLRTPISAPSRRSMQVAPMLVRLDARNGSVDRTGPCSAQILAGTVRLA